MCAAGVSGGALRQTRRNASPGRRPGAAGGSRAAHAEHTAAITGDGPRVPIPP